MSDVFSCHVCGSASSAPTGVKLAAAGPLFFCNAAHYVRWWKQAHPGETLKWDCDAPPLTPEQNLERIADGVVELARAYVAVGDLQGARETLEHSERLTGVALNAAGRALLASLDS
jgi:FimV-like protein